MLLLNSLHSHRSSLLPSSWEYFKVFTPTEIRGCGGYQQHTWPWTANNGHTHTHIVMLWPCVVPPSPPLPPMNLHWWMAFLTLRAWRVLWPPRTPKNRWELPCFPSPWLQTSSQQLHSLPTLPTFPPCFSTYCVACYFSIIGRQARVNSAAAASESASRKYRETKPVFELLLLIQKDALRGVHSN